MTIAAAIVFGGAFVLTLLWVLSLCWGASDYDKQIKKLDREHPYPYDGQK